MDGYAPESKSIIDSRIILPVKSHSQIQELICNDWPSTLPKLLVLGQIVHSGYLQVVDTTIEKKHLVWNHPHSTISKLFHRQYRILG